MRPKKKPDEPKSVRVNFTVSEELLGRIDSFAERHYMTRSAVIAYACTQIVNAEEAKELLKEMNLTLQALFKAVEANPDYEMSEEESKQLDDMQTALNVLSGEYMKKNSDLLE